MTRQQKLWKITAEHRGEETTSMVVADSYMDAIEVALENAELSRTETGRPITDGPEIVSSSRLRDVHVVDDR